MFAGNFLRFIKYYGKGREIKLLGFSILSLIAGCLEFFGIALIYPFILLLVRPESVVNTNYYMLLTNFSHINNPIKNALILGFVVTIIFILKNLFMILNLYLQNRFISGWKSYIEDQFMYYYLFSSYKDSFKNSPSKKLYNLNFLIRQTLSEFVIRIINLLTNLVIVGMILVLLCINFFSAALLTGIFSIFCVYFQVKIFKKKINETSSNLSNNSAQSSKIIIENINNIKEIKILSAEDFFYSKYKDVQNIFNKSLYENNFYASIPPYIIEIFVVLSLFIMAGVISLQSIENVSWMVTSYAIVAASIFRIAPALNRVQSSLNAINASKSFIRMMLLEYETNNFNVIEEKLDAEIKFANSIKLENVFFAYDKINVINDLSLEINKGEFIGIIGLSGAGKSTLADIIMGLLPIKSGKIFVDKTELSQKNFLALRKLIGYVPQQINLLEGSFKRNIAWGIEEKDIDEQRIIDVLKQAQLNDFVANFEQGIDTEVITGASGLSQGQKQRLAIARALYRNPEILIFDEATSSLDVETEHEITKMLNSLKKEKTIIAIAHRLSTLKSCDRLIYLKDGKIVDTGTFNELSDKHPDFERLIKLSNLES